MVEANHNERRFKAGAVINFIGYSIYMGFQWLINIAVVRLLDYENAGTLSLAITITSSFFVVAHFNIRVFQTSDYNNQFSSGEYIAQRIINCAISMILCICFSCICGYDKSQLISIAFYMIFKLSEAFCDVFDGILQKNSRLDYIGYSYAIRGITTFLLFCVSLIVTRNIAISILMMAFGSLVVIFAVEMPWCTRYSSLFPVFRSKSIMYMYRVSIWVFIYYFLFNLLTIFPRGVLEWFWGNEMLGIFTSVAAPVFIIQLSATLILTPTVNLLTNFYSKRDKDGFVKVYWTSIFVILIICFALLSVAHFWGDWILVRLFGDSIAPYTYIFEPLTIITVLLVFSTLESNVLTVIRDMKGLIGSALVGLIPCVIGSILFIPIEGIDGIIKAMVISFSFMVSITFMYILFKLKNISKDVRDDKN